MTEQLLVTQDEIVLAEHAAVIRALGKRVVGDVIEIARPLADARGRVGHGGWLPWLDREFDYSAVCRPPRSRPDPTFKTINNCPPNYTVQDGLCKPYSGR
jgi:hypothetical protein